MNGDYRATTMLRRLGGMTVMCTAPECFTRDERSACSQKEAIQIGLNYMYPEGAGACFADDFVNTPDLPYFEIGRAHV